ncbi:STAS-like domain-containing protein [Janthinobacterium rivuli]|uniref:STAS-like domain-containing protein n=1 Tax=Janthinobacterium rivuli TaxID=2751478 RepID=A0ABY8I819_9BURK|nr:STAS-like domain-containing protein [Janthinobacterium rivuli]WFR81079.1 STAS-like domain-containing protein [Janthinobacterium rivuli]
MTKLFQPYIFIKSFSKFPGGRYIKHGPYSGELFREEVLRPLLMAHDVVSIDLTGARGFGSSFLDESFGEVGLQLGQKEAERRLIIKCDDDPSIVDLIWEKIEIANSK